MAEQSIEGMTVNERLYCFGLMERFDYAAKLGDALAMEQVLLLARFPESAATEISRVVAAHPERYGY